MNENTRPLFTASHALGFTTRDELTAQVGHPPEDWLLVIAKELIDNALDACEEAGVAPNITVAVKGQDITIADNGPGLSEDAVRSIADFDRRASSREAFADPARGAQGLGFKSIMAIPMVLNAGEPSTVTIQSRGQQHTLISRLNKVNQRPEVRVVSAAAESIPGTAVTVYWSQQAGLLDESKSRFLQILADFTILNPHLTLDVDWRGEASHVAATNPGWQKWRPRDASCAWWYTLESFERLLGALIGYGEQGCQLTVREFVSRFRGFAGTRAQQAVVTQLGLSRTKLSDLTSAGSFDVIRIQTLLQAMQEHSRPVKPEMLGVIGGKHLRQRLIELGGIPGTFRYKKSVIADAARPQVFELAYAARPNGRLRLVTGVNWSPGIGNTFKDIGGISLDAMLRELDVGMFDPVTVVMHMASPGVSYHDRGKSSVVMH